MTNSGSHDSPDREQPDDGDVRVPNEIRCIDCLGTCYLGSYPPPEGWRTGDVVFYRCRDCLDRWDIVVE